MKLVDFILGLVSLLIAGFIMLIWVPVKFIEFTTSVGNNFRKNWRDAFNFHRSMRGKTGR